MGECVRVCLCVCVFPLHKGHVASLAVPDCIIYLGSSLSIIHDRLSRISVCVCVCELLSEQEHAALQMSEIGRDKERRGEEEKKD